jgi:solute:Na+ symporter, SSS family
VAIFSFFFSLFYPQNSKILMFFAITGTIWLGGAGAVIIGGLYWKWGTTPGAYGAIIVGAIFGVAGLIIPPVFKSFYHHEFPINNQWLYFISMCLSIVSYVGISLMTRNEKKPFNLEKMLNRGMYANKAPAPRQAFESVWFRIMGINKDFTFTDRIWAFGLLIWNFGWFGIFIAGTLINFFYPIPDRWWLEFWKIYIWLFFILGIPATIWFTFGGIHDIRDLLKTLDSTIRNHADDGRVVHEPENIPVTDLDITSKKEIA